MDYKVACSLARKLAVRPPTVVNDEWPAPTLRVEFPFLTVTIEPYLKTLDGRVSCVAVLDTGARYANLTSLMMRTMHDGRAVRVGIDLLLDLYVTPRISRRQLDGYVCLKYTGRENYGPVHLTNQSLWDAILVMRGEMPGQVFLDLLMDQYLGDVDKQQFSLILERYWRDHPNGRL